MALKYCSIYVKGKKLLICALRQIRIYNFRLEKLAIVCGPASSVKFNLETVGNKTFYYLSEQSWYFSFNTEMALKYCFELCILITHTSNFVTKSQQTSESELCYPSTKNKERPLWERKKNLMNINFVSNWYRQQLWLLIFFEHPIRLKMVVSPVWRSNGKSALSAVNPSWKLAPQINRRFQSLITFRSCQVMFSKQRWFPSAELRTTTYYLSFYRSVVLFLFSQEEKRDSLILVNWMMSAEY